MWVWVKIKPPAIGLQVSVLASICRLVPYWVPILAPPGPTSFIFPSVRSGPELSGDSESDAESQVSRRRREMSPSSSSSHRLVQAIRFLSCLDLFSGFRDFRIEATKTESPDRCPFWVWQKIDDPRFTLFHPRGASIPVFSSKLTRRRLSTRVTKACGSIRRPDFANLLGRKVRQFEVSEPDVSPHAQLAEARRRAWVRRREKAAGSGSFAAMRFGELGGVKSSKLKVAIVFNGTSKLQPLKGGGCLAFLGKA